MIYQTFSRYYQLSLDGKVPPIVCRMDDEHGPLVPNLGEDDEIYLYCLDCSYRLVPGLKFYEQMLNLMNIPVEANRGE